MLIPGGPSLGADLPELADVGDVAGEENVALLDFDPDAA